MPTQRRRWGGRMLDLDGMTPEELEAEDGWEAHAEKMFKAGVDARNGQDRRLHGPALGEPSPREHCEARGL